MDMDFEACRRAFLTRDSRFDGRIFAAVKTTGIYCRPSCPAITPKWSNVRFLPSAAAAPPETSPGGSLTPLWVTLGALALAAAALATVLARRRS